MYTVAHVFHMYNVYSQLMTYESQDTVNINYIMLFTVSCDLYEHWYVT